MNLHSKRSLSGERQRWRQCEALAQAYKQHSVASTKMGPQFGGAAASQRLGPRSGIIDTNEHPLAMRVREVAQLRQRHGRREIRSEGSPRYLEHPDCPFVITVSGCDGMNLAHGTLNAKLKKAGLK